MIETSSVFTEKKKEASSSMEFPLNMIGTFHDVHELESIPCFNTLEQFSEMIYHVPINNGECPNRSSQLQEGTCGVCLALG